jgi:hypothetical protein
MQDVARPPAAKLVVRFPNERSRKTRYGENAQSGGANHL